MQVQENVDFIPIRETDVADDIQIHKRVCIPSLNLAGAVNHPQYSINTYAKCGIRNISTSQSSCSRNIYLMAIKINNLTTVNIYKPSNTDWPNYVILALGQPVLLTGDFNSYHGLREYNSCDEACRLGLNEQPRTYFWYKSKGYIPFC